MINRYIANLNLVLMLKLFLVSVSVRFCKTKPVSVRMNSVFVIDLNFVSYKSLYADNNGIWETSSPRRYFNVEVNAGIVSEVLSSSKGTYTHMLTRQYGKHKSTYERNGALFSRIISTVKTPLGQRGRYAVVQYILKKKR
jgi:hypothetical protein